MHKNEIKLGLSRLTSKFGDIMFDYGNNFWIASLSHLGQKYLAVYQVAETIVAIIFNMFGGFLADRYNRRKILLWTDFICAIVCVLLSMITSSLLLLYMMIAVNIILAVASSFSGPTYKAYVPNIVEKERVVAFNARLETGIQIVNVGTPIVALSVITHLGVRGALLFDGLSFFISFLFILKIKTPEQNVIREKMAAKEVLRDMAKGIQYIRSEKEILFLLVLSAGVNFFLAGYNYLMPFTNKMLSNTSVYAVMLSYGAVGAIAGAAFITIMKKATVTRLLLFLFFSGTGIALIPGLETLFLSLWAAALANFIFNFFLAAYNIQLISIIQMSVQNEMLGRVFSIVFTVAVLFMPVGTIIISNIPHIIKIESFYFVAFGITLLSLSGLAWSRVARLNK